MAGPLRLHILASGSAGNAALVEDAATGRGLLIDCGISKRAFFAGCFEAGFDVARLEGLLVTHEHTDHTKGLGVVARGLARLGVEVPLFANPRVVSASYEVRDAGKTAELRAFSCGDALSIAGMAVHPFSTSHDAVFSCGFRIEAAGDVLGFMTDTGTVTGEAHEALLGVRILGLESNHDPEMLRTGPYPASVKVRVASDRGHLSNGQATVELESLLTPALEQVAALHVSRHNNTYRAPLEAFQTVLSRAGHVAQVHVGYQERVESLV